MKQVLILVTALGLATGTSGTAAPTEPARAAVLVLGALHDLHEREDSFGYDQLRSAITAFRPDVLVLEVRPDELADRKETPGRPEYPAVIWPLLSSGKFEAVAMEPGGADFQAITGQAGSAIIEFRRSAPAAAAAADRLDSAIEDGLLAHWKSADQTQDWTTDALVRGFQALQGSLFGPRFAQAQARWDGFMIERAVEAIRANEDKRILVIGSYRNRHLLQAGIEKAAGLRFLDSRIWLNSLRQNSAGPEAQDEQAGAAAPEPDQAR